MHPLEITEACRVVHALSNAGSESLIQKEKDSIHIKAFFKWPCAAV